MKWYEKIAADEKKVFSPEEMASLRPSARPFPEENQHKMRNVKRKKKRLWREQK